MILEEYEEKKELYESYTERIEFILQEMLVVHGITCHTITGRIKEEESLLKKLKKGNGKYETLHDITDVAGIRIITYFPDDVDTIAEKIEEEFTVDRRHSIDKRNSLEADRFGYLSMHYVVSLNEQRLQLIENKKFNGMKVEIQIRSILQHAWAEIEHDLGYKAKQTIPREIRRSFSRVASLLEMADIEFANIRNRLSNYEREMEHNIHMKPDSVEITPTTLKILLKHAEIIKFNKELHVLQENRIEEDAYYQDLSERLQWLHMKTIGQLLSYLSTYKTNIQLLHNVLAVPLQNCIEYLCVHLVGKMHSFDTIQQYFEQTNIVSEEHAEEEVKRLCLIMKFMECDGQEKREQLIGEK